MFKILLLDVDAIFAGILMKEVLSSTKCKVMFLSCRVLGKRGIYDVYLDVMY